MKKLIKLVCFIFLGQISVSHAMEGGYYDLTGSESFRSNFGSYIGVGFGNAQIDYNSDDPDNRVSGVFEDEFSSNEFLVGIKFNEQMIEYNYFRKNDSDKGHTIKLTAFDYYNRILDNKVEICDVFFNLGISEVEASIKSRRFDQSAAGINVGLALQFNVFEDFDFRLATKYIALDKADDLGIDNVFTNKAALIYNF